jgi:hypothetical protein
VTTPISAAGLEAVISTERFSAYVTATGGDRAGAVALYEWNARISAAFHEILHHVEVIYRNALHQQLAILHSAVPGRPAGAGWFDDPPWLSRNWLTPQAIKDRDAAVNKAGHTPNRPRPGKVVAELSFGFWRYLVTPHYEASLWVPALTFAFPRLPAATLDARRRLVEHHVAPLHLLRNRIAHHEPIHESGRISYKQKGSPRVRYTLTELHNAAIELVGWIDLAAVAWLTGLSQVPGVLANRPDT